MWTILQCLYVEKFTFLYVEQFTLFINGPF